MALPIGKLAILVGAGQFANSRSLSFDRAWISAALVGNSVTRVRCCAVARCFRVLSSERMIVKLVFYCASRRAVPVEILAGGLAGEIVVRVMRMRRTLVFW